MQTDAVEQQEQIAALRDFAATGLAELERRLAEGDRGQAEALENFAAGLDLAELERLLAGEKQAQIAALERFATASDLKTLRELAEEQRTEFDAIDFLRLSNDEEFHSNFLAWLLGPNNNHGIGDYFLKKFLRRVGLSLESIESVDWTPAESQREWPNEVDGQPGSLDILIVNKSTGFLCAIENKIWSGEHSEQLTRYRKALKERYPDYDRHYIFLSPRGTLPYREEEQEYWKPMNYTTILELVEQTIDDTKVREDVRAFLRQYATTLRRKIVPDSNTNIAELVRKIYLEHREAIELIIQHKPNLVDETKQIFRDAIKRQDKWRLDCESNNFVRFRSIDWDDFEVQKTGTGWRALSSDALLLFQINFRDGPANRPYLDLGLSPGPNETIRQKLFDSTRQSLLFTPRIANFQTGWIVLDAKEYILDEGDLNHWGDPSVRAKIEAWVEKFATEQFPAMNEVIVKCLEEYEAEQA